MANGILRQLLTIVAATAMAAHAGATVPPELISGHAPTVDAGFAYYQGRSADSIAEELSFGGYRAIHLVITSEMNVNGDLIQALHDRGIKVWGMVWVGGTYSSAGFPEGWEDWKQVLTKSENPGPTTGGFTYLSPFHPGFREWKKRALADLVTGYPLDGIELVEAFLPNWNGLQSGVYGDISEAAADAFRATYGEGPPDFTDIGSPRHFVRNRALYRKWQEFRVEGVAGFLDYLVNSPGGIRDSKPGLPVATWSLATTDSGSLKKTREDCGEDTALIVSRARPDIHFLQTNWPDWCNPKLTPAYIRKYKVFIDEVRKTAPGLPIGLQADIGSIESMRKGRQWVGDLERVAVEMGFSTLTTYEYHIGACMYSEKPRAVKAYSYLPGTVTLAFDRRIDAGSAAEGRYRVVAASPNGDGVANIPVTDVSVDGNRVSLVLDLAESMLGWSLTVTASGVRDDSDARLLKGYPALEMDEQTIRVEAAGMTVIG